MAFAIQALGVLAGAAIPRGQVQDYGFLFLVVAAATVMPAETEFPCHRSNAMNGKTALLLSGVLSGSLCACVQPPEAAAPAAPPPPPVTAPAPAPVAEPTPGDRWVSIRGATSVGEGCRRWRLR